MACDGARLAGTFGGGCSKGVRHLPSWISSAIERLGHDFKWVMGVCDRQFEASVEGWRGSRDCQARKFAKFRGQL